MTPRQHCLACLQRISPAVFEAALWVSTEHDVRFARHDVMAEMDHLQHHIGNALPVAPAPELAQLMLRQLSALGFQQDDWNPPRPDSALLHKVIERRRGQPLGLAIVAMEVARRLDISLEGVNFPGHFLLRVPGADHLLDPCGGRRLYPRDCRELLVRQFGPTMQLHAVHMTRATPVNMLQRLSRNLRHLHTLNDDLMAALKDADRIVELGQATSNDHMARASLYQLLECPQAERFDLQHALLLSDDPIQRLRLAERLSQLPSHRSVH
ncbi:Regulator of sirC expression, contains transglutaminase-like and TPR domains [Pseudomonas asturiensis]|uniref:Regulator of sirC expression, contains transglutaminase-like and TPR domains n=1 Tax=Pseudomonas asturiensis TaxID=1190415 RepID=A0A1M7LEW4_9PSED|nr:transglutaminase family protein [Pseudomonas asturiensis]SHM75954.1 Regulator of sirC expression, contains transglutaminase-like and TPR domains [Pseudomonas asturiensis]